MKVQGVGAKPCDSLTNELRICLSAPASKSSTDIGRMSPWSTLVSWSFCQMTATIVARFSCFRLTEMGSGDTVVR
jgi:hypothetical protein